MPEKNKRLYVLSPLADNDLLTIFLNGMENWGVQQAKDYATQLESTFQRLAENSEMGVQREDISPETRSFPVGKHIVFYRKQKEIIEVIRILHQKMDAMSHF